MHNTVVYIEQPRPVWHLVGRVGGREGELYEPGGGGVEPSQQPLHLLLPQEGAVLPLPVPRHVPGPPEVVAGSNVFVDLVQPGVVVSLLAQTTEEGVEASAERSVVSAAVAQVPLPHQVAGIALLSQQLRQAGQDGRQPRGSEAPDAASLHAGLVREQSCQ